MFTLTIKASSQGKSFFSFSLYPRDVNSLCVSFTTAPMLQADFIWPQKDRWNTNAPMLVKTGAVKALGGAVSKLRDGLLIRWCGKYWIPTYFCCCKHLSIIKLKDARLYVLTIKYHRKTHCVLDGSITGILCYWWLQFYSFFCDCTKSSFEFMPEHIHTWTFAFALCSWRGRPEGTRTLVV